MEKVTTTTFWKIRIKLKFVDICLGQKRKTQELKRDTEPRKK